MESLKISIIRQVYRQSPSSLSGAKDCANNDLKTTRRNL